jgi:hypothetical protein
MASPILGEFEVNEKLVGTGRFKVFVPIGTGASKAPSFDNSLPLTKHLMVILLVESLIWRRPPREFRDI